MPHRISGREWFAIVALLLLAFALRTVDLTRVPPGLHNDEVVDIKITESVAGGRLTIFFPEDTGAEVLYYYFAAPFFILYSPLSTLYSPSSGSTAFAMRLPAIFLSMISICIIWALARRLLGPVVALTALTGFAIVFWPVEFGRIVLHVVMEVPLAALSAYCFWRAWSSGGNKPGFFRKTWFLWALSGLWLGLSINAYTAARILPLIFIAFGVYVLFVDRSEWRRWWGGVAIMLLVTAIVVLPLFLYLVQNPAADQLGFFDIDQPLVELRQGNLAPVIETSLQTLAMFAFVGDPLPYYDVPGRPVFEPVGALLLVTGLLIALRRWRQPEYAFIVLWFFLSLVPGALSQPAPNYTRTLGVQVVLFAVPGIAVAALLEWRNRVFSEKPGFWTYSVLALLFVGNLAWTVHDYFIVWPAMDIVRFWHQSGLKAVADRLQTDDETSPVAICVPDHLINEHDPWWKPAEQHMRYLLHRPDLLLRYYNCADTMIFIDGPARYAFPDVADVDALNQFPAYSQILAAADPDLDSLSERLGIIVRGDRMTTRSRIHAVLDQHLTEVAVESAVAWAPEADEADQPARVPISFAEYRRQDQVDFLGYTLSTSQSPNLPYSHTPTPSVSLKPGGSFDLVTYWRVTGDLPPALSQFTHVLNTDGGMIAQQDRLALTSASLRAGDIFVQIHRVTLPGDLAEGEYPLTIGLYRPSDGIRLGITQAGQPRGDRLWLKPVVVEE